MNGVTELGYIGLGVSDLAAWEDFAARLVGLEIAAGADPQTRLLRMDYWHWRIALHHNGRDDIDYVGWRVAGPAELAALAERVRAFGIEVEEGDAALAAARHVLGLIRFREPGGLPTEVFYGPRLDRAAPFYPGRRMHGGFVTGEAGLGHVVIAQDDAPLAERFYRDVFGMRGSVEAQVSLPSGLHQLYFFSCNRRQHSLAFGTMKRPKQLAHFMTEYAELDDVGLAYDHAKRHQMKLALELGRHFNDQALSFYLPTPSGWMWELGWGVAPPTGQAFYSHSGDTWGHEHVADSGGMLVNLRSED